MGPRYGMKFSTPASTPHRIAFGMPSANMASPVATPRPTLINAIVPK